ncbi:MAG TPA: 50S ribosomal protein L11 methyltransferase [Chthoniobacterales bacterium]|nr:50S ribosomal protein L11 methyltransferase [Chthoniobacterales bacterium]
MTTRVEKGPKVKPPIYLWRKFVEPRWIDLYEAKLSTRVGDEFAVIKRPDRTRALFEAACKSQKQARDLVKEFGGRIEKLSRDWLKRFTSAQKTASLKIGRRLVVFRSRQERKANSFPYRLAIPAGAAFGTGEHTTTAMSLRLLEEVTRDWKSGWAMIDLGAGSGILALAAKCFGARRVLGIDNDPTAISTAKTNARLNKIDNIDFEKGDVLRMKGRDNKFDVIAANLFSELIIKGLPVWKTRLRRHGWVILSGVLRKQENELKCALRRKKIDIARVRRRGKWIAIAATLS